MPEENEEQFEVVELEYSEDDNEIGFALIEDGKEVEYYYEGFEAEDYEPAPEQPKQMQAEKGETTAKPQEEPKEKSYLGKLATIAGAEANKMRSKAEVKAEDLRGKAEKQVNKATSTAKEKAKELKGRADEEGINRESVSETTADLNQIARDGAEVAAELKGAYDDLMDSFSFLKKKR